MRHFPSEFSELLDAQGASLFETGIVLPPGRTPIALTPPVMKPSTARACVDLLDEHLGAHLRAMVRPIPRNSISGMKKNYSEQLPKTVSVKTCFLQSARYAEYAPAERVGLIAMMKSQSLHRFAEASTGLHLAPGTCQAICYGHGDYSGPHNDHHPESATARKGFVDLHIMFGNDAVRHQWLVYEEDRHFRNIVDVNVPGAIAVYRLPFWHYTTPLVGKPGREAEARRWLLLVTFDIVAGSERRGPRSRSVADQPNATFP